MTLPEKPPEKIVPRLDITTAAGKIGMDWLNTILVRRVDPADDYVHVTDDGITRDFNVLPDDWEAMLELNYPWEYHPEYDGFDENFGIDVETEDVHYKLTPQNTVMFLFRDREFNHIQHETTNGKITKTVGIRPFPPIMRQLFIHNFPIIFQPIVDADTRLWYEKIKSPH